MECAVCVRNSPAKPEALKCCGFPSPETSETQRLIMMEYLLDGLLKSPASPVYRVKSLVTASD